MGVPSFHTVPALWAATLFACGVIAGNSLQLPAWVVFAFSVALLFAAVACRRFAPTASNLFLLLLIVTLGASKILVDRLTADHLPEELIKRRVVAFGTIREPNTPVGNRSQFIFQLDSLHAPDGRRSTAQATLLVTVTKQKRDSVTHVFRFGEQVKLHGQIYRPTAERNPGEFNARAYYEAQGISYLMRVRGHSNVLLVAPPDDATLGDALMRHVVLPLRAYTVTLIDITIGGEEGELLKGILIGERGGIPYATRTAFVNSGIAHILAVSGSNVVVVYACIAMCFSLLRVRRNHAILLNCMMLVLYMLVTGSQPPIVRATIMAVVVLLGKLSGTRSNSLNAIGVAALLILALDARQLFDVGFQLSFAAVLSIVYLYPLVNKKLQLLATPGLWRRGLVASLQIMAVTLVATLGTLPLTAIYFGKISVIGLLTNIIILPITGFSVTLGFVSLLFGWWHSVAGAFAEVNRLLLASILETAKYSGNLAWAFVETLNFKPVHAIPFYIGTLLIFHVERKKLMRALIILLLGSFNLFLIIPHGELEQPLTDRMRVSFIDVGQGDAALVEFPGGKTMLIDAGMKNEEYDAGEHIVVPFLKRKRISTLDWLVASHPHADHIGGVPALLSEVRVNEVIDNGIPGTDSAFTYYNRAVAMATSKRIRVTAFDTLFAINGARVYFLHPPKISDAEKEMINLNNTSVVMKITFGRVSVLFLGDLEKEGEDELVERFGAFLRSDIVKVGHHGSNTSSTDSFFQCVRPSFAVISVGRHNKFNHPSDDVIERLQSLGAEVLRTDEEGAIIFETDGKLIERVLWR